MSASKGGGGPVRSEQVVAAGVFSNKNTLPDIGLWAIVDCGNGRTTMAGSELTRMALVAAVLALAACEPASNSAPGDSRVRLTANSADAVMGDYTIHVSGMLTSDLTPDVAQSYGIQRSENQGLVNLVVLKNGAAKNDGMPVSADVSVSASNLTGQLKTMSMREIVDGDSVYYVGQVAVDDRETINFDFDVRPAGSERLLLVRYSHQFYTR